MGIGRWASWCRTQGHAATCSCTYPTHVSPGKGEKEVAYADLLKKATRRA